MKLISLHCDYIKFRPLKKALKNPEDLSDERKKDVKVDDCLVILTAIERIDESNPDILSLYTDEIKKLSDQSIYNTDYNLLNKTFDKK